MAAGGFVGTRTNIPHGGIGQRRVTSVTPVRTEKLAAVPPRVFVTASPGLWGDAEASPVVCFALFVRPRTRFLTVAALPQPVSEKNSAAGRSARPQTAGDEGYAT